MKKYKNDKESTDEAREMIKSKIQDRKKNLPKKKRSGKVKEKEKNRVIYHWKKRRKQ